MKNPWHILLSVLCLSLGACSHEVKKKNKKTQPPDQVAAFSSFYQENATDFYTEQSVLAEQVPVYTVLDSVASMREQEAKLTDIGFPLSAVPLPHLSSINTQTQALMLTYATQASADDVCAFYQQEMERMGWHQSAMCQGIEQLIYFSKPMRYCAISIRPGTKGLWSTHETIIVVCAGHRDTL